MITNCLNSKYFGVPQNRERCFIVGHLRGRSTAEVFPIEGADRENYLHRLTSIIGHRDGYRRNMQIFDPDGVTETLDTGQGGGRGHHTIEVIGKTRESKIVDRTRILSSDDINSCLRSTDYKDPTKVAIPVSFANGKIKKEIDTAHCLSAEDPAKEGMQTHQSTTRVAIPVLTPDRAEKRQNGRRFKEDGEESFTLTAQDRHGVAIEVTGYNATLNTGGGHDRYGTGTLCERLQRPVGEQSDDDGSGTVFAIDKGYTPKEREVANCIESREDRGLSRRNQEGTLICYKID